MNDCWLNIDTMSLPLGSTNAKIESKFQDDHPYAGLDYWDLRKIIARVAPTTDDVVYEIGGGLGRIVCLFARYPVKKVVGIEVNSLLCGRLRENSQKLRWRRSAIEIRNEDASQTALADGTVFVMVNPFGAETLQAVLTNIHDSTRAHPRPIRLVYVNPLASHREVFPKHTWLRADPKMRTLHGLDILFFHNISA